jgi:hypothetical protein
MTAEVKFRAISLNSEHPNAAQAAVVDGAGRPQAYCKDMDDAEAIATSFNSVGYAFFPGSHFNTFSQMMGYF